MTDEPAVYLHVKIQLVRGKYTLFATAMAEMAPVLEENGWHLVVALSPAIGRLGAVLYDMKMPRFSSGISAMSEWKYPVSPPWQMKRRALTNTS